MSRVTVRLAVFAVAMALTVAGCATAANDGAAAPTGAATATSPSATTTVPTASAEPTTGRPVVPDVLRFTARTIDGGQFDAATLAANPRCCGSGPRGAHAAGPRPPM